MKLLSTDQVVDLISDGLGYAYKRNALDQLVHRGVITPIKFGLGSAFLKSDVTSLVKRLKSRKNCTDKP